MAGSRQCGPVGLLGCSDDIKDGTSIRQASPTPGPLRTGGGSSAVSQGEMCVAPSALEIKGLPAGWIGVELTLRDKTLIRLGNEDFYVTGRPQEGMWRPKTGSTSRLLIYKKANPAEVFRLDYHGLKSTQGRPAWHYNTTQNLGKVEGLTRGSYKATDHAVTAGSKALGRTLTIFRYGGKALFVVGAAMSVYEVYRAESKAREITRQVGGWSGGIAGARVGCWLGIRTGAAIAAVAGQLGPQVATPEEVVTVPLLATIGGIVGAVGLGIGGAIAGTKITQTVYDWIFTPLEQEEWVIDSEVE